MLYTMIYHLARSLGLSKAGGYLAIVLLLMNHSVGPMAGNIYKNNYFAPQIAALPIILLAISIFIRGRPILPFFILGLALNLHSFTSAQGIIVLLVALTWQRKNQLFDTSLYLLGLKATFVCIIGALPILFWMLTQGGSDVGALNGSKEWIEYVRNFNPYIFPSLWPFWGSFGQGNTSILIITIGIFMLATKILLHKTTLLVSIFVGLAVLTSVGLIGTELLETPAIINLQVRRVMTLPWILTGIMMAGYVINRWEVDKNWLVRAPLVLFAVTFGLSEGPTFLFLSFVLILLFEFLFFRKLNLIRMKASHSGPFSSSYGTNLNFVYICAMGIYLGLYLVSDQTFVNLPWWISWWIPTKETFLLFIGMAVVVGLALSISSSVFGSSFKSQILTRNFKLIYINKLISNIQILSIIFIIVLGISWYKVPQLKLPLSLDNSTSTTEWNKTANWAKLNTESGSLFLVPPRLSGFGALSERNIFVDYKSASLGIFSPKTASLWNDRWNLLEDYYSMSAAAINEISQEYDVSYILIEKNSSNLEIDPLYQNNEFSIYELPLSINDLNKNCLLENIYIANSQPISSSIVHVLGSNGVVLLLSKLNSENPHDVFSTIGVNPYSFKWKDNMNSKSCLAAESDDNDFWSNGNGIKDFPFSTGAWINPTEVHNINNVILSKFGIQSGKEWEFRINQGGYLDLALYDHSTKSKINVRTDTIIDANKWSFVVATYDGSGSHNGIKVYINGHKEKFGGGGSALEYIAMENTSSKISFGNYSGELDGFTGMVAGGTLGPFYTKIELTEPLILQLYDTGLSAFSP